MRVHELLVENQHGFIYRWVDHKASASYIRYNAMKGRVRHYLPKAISGEFHSKWFTGLSFSRDSTHWKVAGDICFIVDPARLKNKVLDINGQAVYELGQEVEASKFGNPSTRRHQERLLADAIEHSRTNPTEAYVIGDIRDLASTLDRIVAWEQPPKVVAVLRAFAEQHGVEFEAH